MSVVTERVIMVGIGGACVVAVSALLMGSTVTELAALVAAFGFGSILPSPINKDA